MDIKQLAAKHSDAIIAERRFFHQCPELSFEEVETTKALKSKLEAMGIPTTTFPDYNGVVGEIKGGKPGPVVMLRADIDALPVEEKTGLPFASKNGNMHACGHDCHMAMLLGAAKILLDVKDEIQGTVKLLFQAAEESCHGAEYYVEKGVLDGVAGIFGMHIWAGVHAPHFNIEPGGRMASCDNFTITVEGVSAHGSAPHLGKDAIVAASSIIMNLQTFVSRNNDPLNALVITVGTVKGGQRFNIIANRVEMEGTIRTYSRELRKTLEQDMRRIITCTAEALGCTAELDYKRYLGPIINESDDLTRIARDAAKKLYGDDCLETMPRTMGSEDFAMFMEKIPGLYCFLGSKDEKAGLIYPNHNDKYDVDESTLQRGSALYAQFAVDFLAEKAEGK